MLHAASGATALMLYLLYVIPDKSAKCYALVIHSMVLPFKTQHDGRCVTSKLDSKSNIYKADRYTNSCVTTKREGKTNRKEDNYLICLADHVTVSTKSK